MTKPSIYERVGGDDAFLALATAHHARCLTDPLLSHPFSPGGHPQHVERLAAYWAEVLGGPPTYSSSMSDQPAMLVIHAHHGAPREMGEQFLACFLTAIDDVGLPDDKELRDALRAYMTWAVDDVMTYAPADAEVPTELAVPRWSWDGLVT